jgi:hypothetical protein
LCIYIEGLGGHGQNIIDLKVRKKKKERKKKASTIGTAAEGSVVKYPPDKGKKPAGPPRPIG